MAQMTDASYFPNVSAVNPGTIHLGSENFLSANYGKESDKKNHEVPLGGIVGGINTKVDLSNTTFFGAFRGHLINGEVLIDSKKGTYTQSINSTTRGNRTITDNAKATYFGTNLDLYLLGVGYSTSDYNYLNEFRVDTIPNLVAHDEDKKLKYKNLKIGSAFSLSILRFGFMYFDQKASGNYAYTYYDPTTGNKGSTETSSVTLSTTGFGAGVGFALSFLRSEISFEKMNASKLSIDSSYPGVVTTPTSATRLTLIGETKISFIKAGIRYRMIKGNYVDLNDIITSNLLYEKMNSSDSRNEMNFNFSFGSSKGISPSLFYTTSKIITNELSPVFDNGLKYKATTTVSAYGASLSYLF